jgi:hypothetical protein
MDFWGSCQGRFFPDYKILFPNVLEGLNWNLRIFNKKRKSTDPENMKYICNVRHLLILGTFLLWPLVSRADDQSTIYGVNDDVQGIDVGIVNNANGSVHGFELGAVNQVDKYFGGWQFGLSNSVKRDFKGFQLGLLANVASRSCEGFQAAVLFNDTEEEMHGLQLGIINHTGSLNGIQIGLLNFNDDTKYLGFFPFINAAF